MIGPDAGYNVDFDTRRHAIHDVKLDRLFFDGFTAAWLEERAYRGDF